MTFHAVIGDGWLALGSVAQKLLDQQSVLWIAGTASKPHPVLPTLRQGPGAEHWRSLAQSYGIEVDPVQESQGGSLLREFKNKSFRPAELGSVRERIWQPELSFAQDSELRFALPLSDLESELRAKVMENPRLKRIEGIPVAGIQFDAPQHLIVVLGSGETFPCSEVIYADRWNALAQIEGLPKGLGFTRQRDPMGILQLVLTHDEAPQGVPGEGYFTALSRDAGEEFDRHVWGGFCQEGKQSIWSIAVTQEEGEDNHLLAKKLRKIKSAVDKMFAGTEFMANVRNERVTFHEAVFFARGEELAEPIRLPNCEGLWIGTDAYGPSCAFAQLASHFAPSERSDSQRISVDATHSAQL